MTTTVEELKAKAVETNRTHWDFHDCSMCGVWCGYYWNDEEMIYDCVRIISRHRRSWDDLARAYNQPHPEEFERNEREWGFISEGVNSDTNTTG